MLFFVKVNDSRWLELSATDGKEPWTLRLRGLLEFVAADKAFKPFFSPDTAEALCNAYFMGSSKPDDKAAGELIEGEATPLSMAGGDAAAKIYVLIKVPSVATSSTAALALSAPGVAGEAIRAAAKAPTTSSSSSSSAAQAPGSADKDKGGSSGKAAAAGAGAGGEMSRCIHAMLDGKVSFFSDYLQLPAGSTWPTFESDKLFIRELYAPFFRDVLKKCSRDFAAGAIVIGTPGIGKSAFGMFALLEAVKAGRTVVYQSRKAGCAIVNSDSRSFRELASDEVAKAAELKDSSALYICDGDKHHPCDGFKLLITSPGVKHTDWFEFEKTGSVDTLVMPQFSTEEMGRLFELAFQSATFSEELYLELLRKWGNNPRNVLTKAKHVGWQKELENAAGSLDIFSLAQAIKHETAMKAAGGEKHFHRLLSLVPSGALLDSSLSFNEPEYYLFHRIELPSTYVEGKFESAVLEADEEQLYAFLRRSSDDASIAGFRGILYERLIVIPRILHSDDDVLLTLQSLGSPTKAGVKRAAELAGSSICFPKGLKKVSFASPEELAAKWTGEDGLFIPSSKHFPVVDLVLRVRGQSLLINATVSLSHTIKVSNEKLKALIDAVGLNEGDKEIPFVWVLPSEAFEGFDKAGTLEGVSKELVAHTSHPIGSRIAQYKLLLPVPSTRTAKRQKLDNPTEASTQ